MTQYSKEDYHALLVRVLRQAIDDYVKLQHPSKRRRKDLERDFHTAVDMFFDSEYRMLNIKNDAGEDMSLKDFVTEIIGGAEPEIERLQEHIIVQAVEYWENKEIRTLDIPSALVVDGHIYRIVPQEEGDYRIDLDDKLVYIDMSKGSTTEEDVVKALFEIILHHQGIRMSRIGMERISKSLFVSLRMNNCFVGN